MVNPSLADISLKKLNIDPDVNVSQKHIDQLFSGIQPLLAQMQKNVAPQSASKKVLAQGICHPWDQNSGSYGADSLPCLPGSKESLLAGTPSTKSTYSCKNCEIMAVKKNLGAQYTTDKMFPTICPTRNSTEQCAAAGGQWGLVETDSESQNKLAYCKNPASIAACKEKCKEIRECKYYSVDTEKDKRCILFTTCDQPITADYSSYKSYAYTEEQEADPATQNDAYLKEVQAKKNVKKITKLLIHNFDDKVDEVNDKIKNYNMQVIGQKHMGDLKDRQGRDINQVQETITGLKNKNNINNRLADYYNSQNNSYSRYIPYIKIPYWVLLTIYSCYFLAYKQLIKNKKLAIITLGLWVLPFTLKPLLYWLFPNKIVTPPVSYTCPTTPPSTIVKPPPLPVIPTPTWKPVAPPTPADVCEPPTLMNALRNLF